MYSQQKWPDFAVKSWYHGMKISYSRKILHSWKTEFACLKTSNALERASQLALVVNNSLSKCRRHKRQGFNPWVGRCPRVGTGNPLQYPCLDNSMNRGALWATVHGVSQSQTRLHTHSFFQCSGNVTHLKSAVQAICNRTLITGLTHVAFIILKKFWILKGLSVTISRGSQVMKSVRTVFSCLSPSTNRRWNFFTGFSGTFFICININHKKNTKDLWEIMKGQILFQVSYVHYHI